MSWTNEQTRRRYYDQVLLLQDTSWRIKFWEHHTEYWQRKKKAGSYLLCMVYINYKFRFTTKCPEVQSIHKLKIRTHRDQIIFILCHGAYTTQPPMLGLLMTWEWNAIKLCILKYPVLKYRWYPTCNYPVNNKSYSGNDWRKTYSMCCRS